MTAKLFESGQDILVNGINIKTWSLDQMVWGIEHNPYKAFQIKFVLTDASVSGCYNWVKRYVPKGIERVDFSDPLKSLSEDDFEPGNTYIWGVSFADDECLALIVESLKRMKDLLKGQGITFILIMSYFDYQRFRGLDTEIDGISRVYRDR